MLEIREILAAATAGHDRGELLPAAHAEALAALARPALNATEALARAGGR